MERALIVRRYISHLKDMIAAEQIFVDRLRELRDRSIPILGEHFTYDALILQSEARISCYREAIAIMHSRSVTRPCRDKLLGAEEISTSA